MGYIICSIVGARQFLGNELYSKDTQPKFPVARKGTLFTAQQNYFHPHARTYMVQVGVLFRTFHVSYANF